SQEHTLTLRGYGSFYSQERARIGTLETQQSGGSFDSRGGAVLASMTSRFRQNWVNELRASYTLDSRDGTPSLRVPQGIVRVGADPATVAAGGRAVSNLVFGGDPSLSSSSDERTLEVADELSLLVGDRHRVKLGLLANHSGFTQESASNRLGTFVFNSLEDFQARTPASFTRTLSSGVIDGGGWNAAGYLGDAFRPSEGVQFTFGARVEGSRFDRAPAANPDVLAAFGRRTDFAPSEIHVSPRAGFSWRMSETGAPLRLLRGGFGEFRGRTPYELYAATLAGTGTGGEIEVSCVGANVPMPDWNAYRTDPSAIPTTCTDGTLGGGAVLQQPNVTLFERGFQAPRSWRASLGFQAQVFQRVTASIDGTFSRGVAQYGVRDLNLRDAAVFTLADEADRPVFAPPTAIVPTTGQTSLYASRKDPRFARVYELNSDLASQTEQLTLSVNGLLPRLISAQASYTLTHSRDQTGFGFGGPSLGFQFTPTRGNPNVNEWAPSDQDRRHSFTLVLGKTFGRSLETSLIGRASSGQPYTPIVGGDVNGDGARNDAAFVFTPTAVSDTAMSAALGRILGGSNRITSCLNAQAGRIAQRNSCRGPWTESLDFRATWTPQNARLQRRVALSLDAFNLPAGLDLLVHGGSDLHGWGQGGRPDNVLLYPTGFDPATKTFRYRVNEGFGQTRVFRTAAGSPFGVQLSARITFGARQQGGAGLLGIAFGGGAG
ncbi:MAG TPA: TonB-dependent receptor, partial [Longimicrobiaceae bacterium]